MIDPGIEVSYIPVWNITAQEYEGLDVKEMKKSDQNEEKTRADSDLDPDDTTPWDTL